MINEEIHQLPADVFSIERISVSRLMKNHPTESIGSTKSGIILRCKLLGTSNPIVPALRLHIPTRYPEQAPEILSLTKTLPPQLEFSEGHPFFEQISSIFLSHLLQLPAEHTISDILHLWVSRHRHRWFVIDRLSSSVNRSKRLCEWTRSDFFLLCCATRFSLFRSM